MLTEILKRLNVLEKENAFLREENAFLRAELSVRDAKIKELELRLIDCDAKIAKLEAKLNLNSKNSSKPPSSDPPWMDGAKKTNDPAKKRAKGGQRGHKGSHRELLPAEEVDAFVRCEPPATCDCGGDVVIDESDFEQRQVFEIPVIKPHVTEYQIFIGECQCCGKNARGDVPIGTAPGILGPRTLAIVALLSGKFHLSKRDIKEMLATLFGLTISLGQVSKAEQRVSEAVAASHKEAADAVKNESVVHMDETGFKVASSRAWIWLISTSLLVLYFVRPKRNLETAKRLLGEMFSGHLVSDRYGAYNFVDASQRQLCWAHLVRDIIRLSERQYKAGDLGNRLLIYVYEMFHLWHEYKRGIVTRSQLQALMLPIQCGIEARLEEGLAIPFADGLCQNLLKNKQALWSFIEKDGVEPTNNQAERDARKAVLWRKTSFGTQSENGSRFVERILTVVETFKRQSRDVLEFVTKSVDAHLRQEEPPSLLPVG